MYVCICVYICICHVHDMTSWHDMISHMYMSCTHDMTSWHCDTITSCHSMIWHYYIICTIWYHIWYHIGYMTYTCHLHDIMWLHLVYMSWHDIYMSFRTRVRATYFADAAPCHVTVICIKIYIYMCLFACICTYILN